MSLRQSSEETPIPTLQEEILVNENRGTLCLKVPLPLPKGRGERTPDLSLSYGGSSGSVFGAGWSCRVPSVSRSADGRFPLYDDSPGADSFLLDGQGELTPCLKPSVSSRGGHGYLPPVADTRINGDYIVTPYEPIQGSTASRIEQWRHQKTGETHWRTCSADGTTSIYGLTASARICDPDDPLRISRWLLERRLDSHGNGELYEYKKEDGAKVDDSRLSESGRLRLGQFANRYLKRVRYGNSKPVDSSSGEPASGTRWHFQLLFDYGEHHSEAPGVEEVQPWPVRPDPFSEWTAGFEVRTWRLCHRILIFHDMEELGSAPFLSDRIDLTYNDSDERARSGVLLMGISRTGMHPGPSGDPIACRVPPLTFRYTEAEPEPDLSDLEGGVMPDSRPMDLFGDGMAGLLRKQGGDWFYRRASGNGTYEAEIPVLGSPSDQAGLDVSDLEGIGRSDLIRRTGHLAGYHELNRDRSGWSRFRAMKRQVSALPGQHSNWIDLTGDGRADLSVSAEGSLSWFGSDGIDGFQKVRHLSLPLDREQGPAMVANAPSKGQMMANLSGSGQDVVQVDNGRVSYWPHLGHGQYGRRVVMDSAPRFDRFGNWDPGSIRFADLNGSGVDDLIYLGDGKVRYWINESGNGFGPEQMVDHFPELHSHHQLEVMDLFSEGTPCLLSIQSLPGRGGSPLRYRRLAGRVPPRLLCEVDNQMGKTIEVGYTSSATFWLKDREEGRDWHTPSVAHQSVVQSVRYQDEVTGTETVSRYRYRDAYLDEREGRYRGFGLVEVVDSEGFDELAGLAAEEYAAPTCRKIWFHDGRPDPDSRLRGYWDGDDYADTPLQSVVESASSMEPPTLEQAWGQLAGRMIREEIHAAGRSDGDASGTVPLLVREQSWRVSSRQQARQRVRAACRVRNAETITRHYEGIAEDPRVDHELRLAPDHHGYPQLHCNISYPRRLPDEQVPEQGRYRIAAEQIGYLHVGEDQGQEQQVEWSVIQYGEILYSNQFECFDMFPLRGECFSYEVIQNILLQGVEDYIDTDDDLPDAPSGPVVQYLGGKRRFFYGTEGEPVSDAASISTPLRIHHEETLQFTDKRLEQVYGERLDGVELADLGYVRRNGAWWGPSTISLWQGRDGFYLPAGTRDYRGTTEEFTYDEGYRMVTAIRDSFGLLTRIEPDYAVMKPAATEDPNGNRAEVLYDGLGRILATKHRGFELDGEGQVQATGGGPIAAWQPPVPLHEWENTPDLLDRMVSDPDNWLDSAATVHYSDLFAWERSRGEEKEGAPPVSIDLVRDTAAVEEIEPDRVLVTLRYSDGFGREVQNKQLDGPGEAWVSLSGGVAERQHVAVRWKASGGVRYNNKGKPVRMYEPLFSATHRFESDEAFTRHGSGPGFHYDGLGRHVKTDEPGGFVSRVALSPWRVDTYDANDAIRDSFYYQTKVETGLVQGAEREAVERAEAHANTPETVHLAPGGFPVLRDEWIDSQSLVRIRSSHDSFGQVSQVTDPRTGNQALSLGYDLAGQTIFSRSQDAGERRTLYDVMGHPVIHWTASGDRIETRYDTGWRVTGVEVRHRDDLSTPVLMEQFVYGEEMADREEAKARNLLGCVWKQSDQVGEQVCLRYDSRGNVLEKQRRVTETYREICNWNGSVGLEERAYTTRFRHDPLGRLVECRTADGAVHRMAYQPSGGLNRYRVSADSTGLDEIIVDGTRYNAAGQLLYVRYGNGVETSRQYEEATGRLKRLLSRRPVAGNSTGQPTAWKPLQEVDYTYDPAGNLTRKDDRTREHLFSHLPGELSAENRYSDYSYDALYRLVRATGWTHQALQPGDETRNGHPPEAFRGTRHLSLNNAEELVPYARTYDYDPAGNLTRLKQTGQVSWTREMWVSDHTNRSLPASLVEASPGTDPESRFDQAGNLRRLAHLDGDLLWGYRGELLRAVVIEREGSDDDAEYYRYGSDGSRVRKVEQRLEHGRPVLRETLWLDGCEIRRESRGGQLDLERTTSVVEWQGRKVALLHTWIEDRRGTESEEPGQTAIHYLLADHRGSVAMELNGEAELIHYEEYFPYGGSAFLAGDRMQEISRKTYRYCGRERDDATGLYAIGFRCYAPWLCRWISPDPSGPADGLNLYQYLRCSPVQRVDPDGLNSRLEEDFQQNRDQFEYRGKFVDPSYSGVYKVYTHEDHGLVGQLSHLITSQREDGLFNLFPVVTSKMLDQSQMIEIHQLHDHFQQPEERERPSPAQSPPPPPDPSPESGVIEEPPAQDPDPVPAPTPADVTEQANREAEAAAAEVASEVAESVMERAEESTQQEASPTGEGPTTREALGVVSNLLKLVTVPAGAMAAVREVFERQLPEARLNLRQAELDAHRPIREHEESRRIREGLAREMEQAETNRAEAQQRAQQARERLPAVENEVRTARADALRHHQNSSRALANLVRQAFDGNDESFNRAADEYDRVRSQAPEPGEWTRKDQEARDTRNRIASNEAEARRQENLRDSAERRLEARNERHRPLEANRQAAENRMSQARERYRHLMNQADLRFGDSRAARALATSAPVLQGAARVLGPVGTGISVYNLVTAETHGQVIQAGVDLVADGIGYIPHPATITFSIAYSGTQLVDAATGGRISSGIGDGIYRIDTWVSGRNTDDSVPAYQQTAGWRIAQFLEDKGVRL